MRAPAIGHIGDRIDLVIRQGASFGPHNVTMTNPDGTPVDLTGATVRGKLRMDYDDATAAADLAVTILDAPGGEFEFGLDANITAGLSAGRSLGDRAGAHVWDMEIEFAGGSIMPLYWGTAQVMAEATW